jgi:hypothetical protein
MFFDPPRSSLDPAVRAFRGASGATDLRGINSLVKYLRPEGLFSGHRLLPFKSAQNAGTGSTAFCIGGATEGHATLVNSPTWGASAMTFNNSTQYATIPDFLGTETLTVWVSR